MGVRWEVTPRLSQPVIPTTNMFPLAAALIAQDAIQIFAVALLAALYARRAHTLANSEPAGGDGDHGRPPRGREACFYAGCAIVVGALVGLGRVGEQLLFAHMIQLLLIGGVAPLLLVLGLTEPLLAPILRISVFDRLRLLANPLIALPLWAICFGAWHLPGPYQTALEHPGVDVLQHAALLACGANLWMCLFGPLPTPSWFGHLGRLLYIAATGLLAAALGNLLLWSDVVFYPFYLDGDSVHRASPIADQNLAGGVLLIEASLLTVGLFCWLFVHTAREARERERSRLYSEHVRRLRDGGNLRGQRLSDLDADPPPRLADAQADAGADDRRDVRRRAGVDDRRQRLHAAAGRSRTPHAPALADTPAEDGQDRR